MRVAIGLGSNLGDRLAFLQTAIEQIAGLGVVVSISSLYRSDPVGGPEQPDFLNAVVVIDTERDLTEVLVVCQQIETGAGRVRQDRWGPRPLDLDILSATAPPVATDSLVVPHERLAQRRFALEPLAEVWPDAATGSGTARASLERVLDQSVELLAPPGWEAGLTKGAWWVAGQVMLLFLVAGSAFWHGLSLPFDGHWIGGAVFGGGLLFSVAAMRSLGSSLTPYPQPLQGAVMVSSGPYGLVRHPIYGGIVITMMGLALYKASLVALLGSVAVGGFFWLKSSFEERRLLVAHSRYRHYRDDVARRLIPFIV